jgi:SAM-dependent methyltransferase
VMIERETVCCELCGDMAARRLYIGVDRLLKHPGSFPLVCCVRCGLIYQSPRPADIAPFYEGNYPPYNTLPSRWRPILRRHDEQNRIFVGAAGMYYGIMHKVVPLPWGQGRVLDIGCAAGDLLLALDHFGWEVYGVEPNPVVAAKGNQRLSHCGRAPITVGILEDAHYPDNFFDVVTLWHVIEHLPHPLATMREVRRILKPGGICIIQTPAWGCLESMLFGQYWAGLDSPRHLWIFSHLTLQALLERTGLRIWQRPATSSYDIFVMSALFWADAVRGEGAGPQLWQRLYQPWVRSLLSPLFRAIDRSGLGSQLTVAAVKPREHG